jgi:hypothetical protein
MPPVEASIPIPKPTRVPLDNRAGIPVARNQRATVSSVRQMGRQEKTVRIALDAGGIPRFVARISRAASSPWP